MPYSNMEIDELEAVITKMIIKGIHANTNATVAVITGACASDIDQIVSRLKDSPQIHYNGHSLIIEHSRPPSNIDHIIARRA